jgi:hypothetical protein
VVGVRGRRARRAAAAALAAVLFAAPNASAQGDPPALGAGRVGAQVALGVPAGAVGYVAGGLATRWVARRLGASDGRASQLAERGAYAGVAALTAVPPTLLGARGPGSGRYVAALGGAVAGGLGSVLVVRLGRARYGDRDGQERPCTVGCKLAAVAAFTLPSVGATVGYNLSRRR